LESGIKGCEEGGVCRDAVREDQRVGIQILSSGLDGWILKRKEDSKQSTPVFMGGRIFGPEEHEEPPFGNFVLPGASIGRDIRYFKQGFS
jgi:hypothetical protein